MGSWGDQTSLHSPASWEHLTTPSILVSQAKLWSLAENNVLHREQSAANPQEENSLLRGGRGTTQRCSMQEDELSCIFSSRRIARRGSVVLRFCFQHKYWHFLLTQEFTAGCSAAQVRNLFLQVLEQLLNLQALVMLDAICRAWNPDKAQSSLFIFRFSFIYDALKTKQNRAQYSHPLLLSLGGLNNQQPSKCANHTGGQEPPISLCSGSSSHPPS